jgi:hypothetical protein
MPARNADSGSIRIRLAHSRTRDRTSIRIRGNRYRSRCKTDHRDRRSEIVRRRRSASLLGRAWIKLIDRGGLERRYAKRYGSRPLGRFDTALGWYDWIRDKTTGLNGITTGLLLLNEAEREGLSRHPSKAVLPVGRPFNPVAVSRIQLYDPSRPRRAKPS